ncbi:apolipoprotein N-acyltransferase [Nocardioides sp.]|uniref:apolipoprotein N-acyltransferase n=1 Tax=Nocardioides sp. TaxID=35761 RepID=UPI003D10B414
MRVQPVADIVKSPRLPIRGLLATASGVALATTSAPWSLGSLLPVAVAGWILALHGTRGRSGAVVGYLFGAAYSLTLLFWLRAVGTDSWLLVSLLVASYYALLGMGIAWLSRRRAWPLWTAVSWVAVDMIRTSWPFGGFPWGRLAWSVLDTPLSSWLPWVGANGVSFLAAFSGSTLAWILLRVTRAPIRVGCVAAGVIGLVMIPTFVRPASLTPGWEAGLPSATVAAIQGDVPGRGNDLIAHHQQVTRNHIEATIALSRRVDSGAVARPDLVIWPENSTAVDPTTDAVTRSAINEAVEAIGVPVLVGAITDGATTAQARNQGILWRPVSGPAERYTKRHPVPFGEYIPFRGLLGRYDISRLGQIPRDMARGDRSTPLRVSDRIQVADLICFDVAFDDSLAEQVRSGAQFIAVQTSNATFIRTNQIEQQFAISRVRAVETGRTVVVAATNGITGIIGPDGSVRELAEPQTRAVLVSQVPLQDKDTPALFLSPWIGWACVVVAALALVTPRRRLTVRSRVVY